MFVDNTMSAPDKDATIECVCTVRERDMVRERAGICVEEGWQRATCQINPSRKTNQKKINKPTSKTIQPIHPHTTPPQLINTPQVIRAHMLEAQHDPTVEHPKAVVFHDFEALPMGTGKVPSMAELVTFFRDL